MQEHENCANGMQRRQTDESQWMTSQKLITQDDVTNKSHKTITQSNCRTESHETGHEWDDVMNKIGKIMVPGNAWKYD